MQLEDIVQSVIDGKSLIAQLPGTTDQALFDFMKDSGFSSRHELMTVFEERLINAREHGGGKSLAVFAQKLMGFLYFVIVDRGPGIHTTLPRNPHLSDTKGKSPMALIRLAMEEGITGTSVVGRGVGLYLLSDYINRNGGEAILISDGGLVVQVRDVSMQEKSSHPWDGTLIAVKVTA